MSASLPTESTPSMLFRFGTLAKEHKVLSSPDGLSRIVAESSSDGWPLHVQVIRKGRTFPTDLEKVVSGEAEAAWAPDSSSFFVTYSDAGAVGTYHVVIYRVDDEGLHSHEPIPNGRTIFPPYCLDPEIPNVGAVRWGSGSSTIVIAVEVPPHSSCADMGTFRAFEISLPDARVLRQYGQLETKRLFWPSLGVELRHADDRCIRKPKRCVPLNLSPH